ncbi:MAG TPA: helix-turn-helix domain-containing protein [Streptosporangiaceae bacterium]
MARRDASPDFIEALARGLDVIRAFQPHQPVMSLAAVATAAGLARPTARRMLLPLEQLGYARPAGGGFELTPAFSTSAAETPLETLTGEYLPLLLQTAGAISADWARYQSAPQVTAPQPGALTASTAASRLQAPDTCPVSGHPGRPRPAGPITIRPEDSISGQEWSQRR